MRSNLIEMAARCYKGGGSPSAPPPPKPPSPTNAADNAAKLQRSARQRRAVNAESILGGGLGAYGAPYPVRRPTPTASRQDPNVQSGSLLKTLLGL